MALRRSASMTIGFSAVALFCFLMAAGMGDGGPWAGAGALWMQTAKVLGVIALLCGLVWLFRTLVPPKTETVDSREYEED